MAKIQDLDMYGLLEVAVDATEKEILRAYRKKALKCHPDKNPDNPKAAEEFHQLSKVLGVLTDAAARAAYDKSLKAKKAAELRHRDLDSKRKKLKEDLESRERAAQGQKAEVIQVARTLEEEIERLRKEGSRLVEEEQARLAEELKQQEKQEQERSEATSDGVAPRLRVKWKAKKSDPENGGYNHNLLEEAFCKYGEVTAVIVSTKKCGSAIVEFESAHSALRAVQLEVGLVSNPLTLSWLSGQPDQTATTVRPEYGSSEGEIGYKRSSQEAFAQSTGDHGNLDFESLVLRRMRQAEERKRLTEEMRAEEDAGS